jgi:pyridoxine 5-phosphate synthase
MLMRGGLVKKKKIRLGVNIDHAATLRQVRGGTTDYPNMLNITNLAIRGGADQITIHLREDRRHIQESDVQAISKNCSVLLNLEMAAQWSMVKIARKYRPDWCCFVPEKREELTTEGGLNVEKEKTKIKRMVEKLQFIGIECSMFIEPSLAQVKASYDVGADAIELHTGHWVLCKGREKEKEWKRLSLAAEYAHSLGLGVHAGHGLDEKTAKEICRLPYLAELNIGHSLICYSLEYGLQKAVRRMKNILR